MLMTSVTIASPVFWRASARYFSPSSASPWNAYGLVRGLNAPPRSATAPASFTACATSSRCVLSSTLQGPAMTPIFFPPIAPAFPSGTVVRSFFTSTDAIL